MKSAERGVSFCETNSEDDACIQGGVYRVQPIHVLLLLAFIKLVWFIGKSFGGKTKDSSITKLYNSRKRQRSQSFESKDSLNNACPIRPVSAPKPSGLSSIVQAFKKPTGEAKPQTALKTVDTLTNSTKKEPQQQATVIRVDTSAQKGSGESGSAQDDEETKAKKNEIIRLTENVLESIRIGDWETYTKLVSSDLTAFEPEACGHLVKGLEFHKFYFDHNASKKSRLSNTTVLQPNILLLGDDAACIAYIRLNQTIGSDGNPVTEQFEESRVWHRIDGAWRNVHFHRSRNDK